MLGRLRNYLTLSSAKLLANALILPYFDYCSCAWSNCAQYVKETLVKQHKKMARVVLRTEARTSTNTVLQHLNWVPIQDRWDFQVCKMMHAAVHSYAPPYLNNTIVTTRNTHRYSTRSSSDHGLIIPAVRTQTGKKSFSHYGSTIWNNLHPEVKRTTNKQQFMPLYWRDRDSQ